MKVGIVGAGSVGSACLHSLVLRGPAREIVVVNRNRARAKGLITDLQYGALLAPPVELRDGDYADLSGAALVMITAGINEKTGGATDRSDPAGRLRLLDTNAVLYRDIVAKVAAAAPQAIILVVTDPPDPLADLARLVAGHERVLSTGTFLDSLRFRFHLGRRLKVSPKSVDAQVLGEHGTSQVFLWSSARVAGMPIQCAFDSSCGTGDELRRDVEQEVRYANITIIEGTGASQLGIGVAAARITEAVLRDEQVVIPIGSFIPKYGVTLSLPSVVGRRGVSRILEPEMSEDERQGLQRSAEVLRNAVARIKT
ncbi:MAG TPA: NAD(P)-binding domain-containing protein [Burkholderiales bacterium]|nr:NAD(P)-binding domain-containing protein [Burkholderiales bacterium]